MRYQYAGPGPIEALSGGELIRPGDIREFDVAPTWGPWDLIDEPAPEPAPEPVPAPAPAPVTALPPLTPKGM